MRSLLPTLRPSLAARRAVARLAMWAMLAAALVPGFSRLVRPGEAWGPLCQSQPSAHATAAGEDGAPPPGHAPGDACALCTLAHTTPALASAAAPTVETIDYAPPAPPAEVAVRSRVAQSRAPGARAPPMGGPSAAA